MNRRVFDGASRIPLWHIGRIITQTAPGCGLIGRSWCRLPGPGLGLECAALANEKIMSATPACPQCTLENTYPDGDNFVCADCGHEWPQAAAADAEEGDEAVVKDANGAILSDGDAVVLIKDLKVKGSSITLKMGTKVKSIRLVGGDHEVDCRMDAGSFMLKACFLRKV